MAGFPPPLLPAPGSRRFATTHWSLVIRAGEKWTEGSREALTTLCETYWYPLYAYARRRGFDVEDAQDYTQAFFVRLLSGDLLARATPERGRFRAFLVTAFKYFLANARDYAMALKRGGGQRPLSLEDAESRYEREPRDDVTPELLFEQRWALTLIDNTLKELERNADQTGRRQQFDCFRPLITGDGTPYKKVGEQLAMSEGAVKVAVHRLRRRFANVLRQQIADTVESPAEIDDELQYLLRVITEQRTGL
jgi:RNA polymerase sigma factor (sigma-70 family)